jgi:nucleoside-diphosphate-sugar epimerase
VRAFVTGGGGFLGQALVRRLRARGDEVVSYSRAEHPGVTALGARCMRGDLADARALRDAMRGADVVFHTAAKAGFWGRADEYRRTNRDGTLHVLAAVLENGVRRLVHTSSPSVCFDGKDHVRARNDLPLSTRVLADYPRTKAAAERAVLAANGKRGLATCALRPHLLVGAGDPHLLPRIAARAQAGRLFVVGDGRNEVSITAVENAAHAHVLAADRLAPGAPHAGRAYFLGQSEPVALWPWLAAVLDRAGLRRPRGRVPLPLAYVGGLALEGLWTLLRRAGEPPMTRFLALQLARSHSYDLAPAQRDFGYAEEVSLDALTEEVVLDLRRRFAGAS